MGKEHDLASILSHVEERIVTSDYTVRYQGKIYQMGRSDIRPGLRGGRVRVEQRLDGSLAVQFRQRYVSVTECQPQPKALTPPKPTPNREDSSREDRIREDPTNPGPVGMDEELRSAKEPTPVGDCDWEKAGVRRETG